MMSNIPNRGTGFGTPTRPQTGNMGPVPSLNPPRNPQHHDAGITAEVQEKFHNLSSGAGEMAGQVRDTARRWAGSAADAVEQGYESTRHSIEEAGDEIMTFIRRHPAACLMGAFAAGALLATCLTLTAESRSTTHRLYWQ
jgi:hypothetical protein